MRLYVHPPPIVLSFIWLLWENTGNTGWAWMMQTMKVLDPAWHCTCTVCIIVDKVCCTVLFIPWVLQTTGLFLSCKPFSPPYMYMFFFFNSRIEKEIAWPPTMYPKKWKSHNLTSFICLLLLPSSLCFVRDVNYDLKLLMCKITPADMHREATSFPSVLDYELLPCIEGP